MSLGGNTLQARPNVDAVQEFKIQTSNFSAEFGRNSGSVVSVVTKSGTNNLSGNAWVFSRDDRCQARELLCHYGSATSQPESVRRDDRRAHYHPRTLLGRNRRSSSDRTKGSGSNARIDPPDDRGHRAGARRRFQLPDPAAHRPGNGAAVSRQPDSARPDQPGGAQTARADAAAQYRGLAPRQNNFVASPSQDQEYDQYMWRFDHTFNSKWNIFYRHFIQDVTTSTLIKVPAPRSIWDFLIRTTRRTQHATGGVNTILSTDVLQRVPGRVSRGPESQDSNLPFLNPRGLRHQLRPAAGRRLADSGCPTSPSPGCQGSATPFRGRAGAHPAEYQISNVMSMVKGDHNSQVGRGDSSRR